jgi:dienelactone hydrolase
MFSSTPAILTPLCFCLQIVLATVARGGDDPQANPPRHARTLVTRTGVRFGVWPAEPKAPAPTLFILASTIAGTLDDPYYRQSGNVLAQHGYLCVSVDLPCHGQERRPDEPDGIGGWRYRCDRGEDFTVDLVARLRAVLDHLIAAGLTDPDRVAACGTSRGGFAALHFAAAEPRVKCVAAFAPVIDLGALREFRGAEAQPLVRRLDISARADDLAGRALWLVIGDRDERVGTDHVIHFARRVTTASLTKRRPARVDLHVLSEPKGHTTPAGAPEQGAAWIDQQMRHPRSS